MIKNISNKIDKKARSIKAKLAAKIIKSLKLGNGDFVHYDFFDLWVKNGFYVIPNHFYQPIPDIERLNKGIFKKKSELIGISFNDEKQLKLLYNFLEYREEYNLIPDHPSEKDYEFSFNNIAFDWLDALVYYCIIRHFKPKNIIEVGSGWSSKLAAQAAIRNGSTQLTCIEPFPQEFMKKGFPGLTKLYVDDVEDLPLSVFSKLENCDILFIDSSHTVKTGGDVNYLFLEVLPRLKKGVLVHIHDIFFPFDYPEGWVVKEHRFWAEQYLLQAFLMFNQDFSIIFANNYLGHKYPKQIKSVFPKSSSHRGGSIWIRRNR